MINFETNLGEISEKEKQFYIDFVKNKVDDINNVESVVVKDAGNDEVDIEWQVKNSPKFERIARITGLI